MIRLFLFAMALSFATSSFGNAENIKIGGISILAPYAKATPVGARVAGGYLTLLNNGAKDDTLLSVQCECADAVEIHQMTHKNGVMAMKQLEQGLRISAGEKVSLAPGGLHLMFIGLKHQFFQGDTIKSKLHFEMAGDVEVTFNIVPLRGQK